MAPDEGMISDTEEIGNYGPYKQSLRKEIYQAYAKYMIEQGKSIPMFLYYRRLRRKEKTRSCKSKTRILWCMGEM